jgi:hypothetical protein
LRAETAIGLGRKVEPELLDELPANDPGAMRSRRDLQRLNRVMGNASILAGALRQGRCGPPGSLLELGAGDATFLLDVCRRSAGVRAPQGSKLRTVLLLDRQNIVTAQTRLQFEELGWRAEPVVADVFEWLRRPVQVEPDAIVANLFLHHFSDEQLSELFALASVRTQVFAAVEPRRAASSLFFSKLVWLIGCNRVTVHDAQASVRAGFAGTQLSQLWPRSDVWSVHEGRAGRFGHLFVASRRI